MGGGGGKGGSQKDYSMELYQQQQADLARQKAEDEAKQRAEAEAEQKRRDELRRQMLGESIEEDEEVATQQNSLG